MTVTPGRRTLASKTPDFAIEAYDLQKTYRTRKGPHHAVAGLDLRVPVGGVHGFLGPNGSGKTTTIRMLLGLIRADAGSIRVFDQEIPESLPAVVGRIGAIVEQPKFFPAFTARKNLTLLATGIGVSRQRVDEVLDEVGLAERARDRFRTFSLGMKQRLAIAATLLKDPELLIFDEPTNGLDPAGIHEIRDTMRGLASQGKTVLVSSHILSEVQQIADTVSIIGRGRLLAEGDVDDILDANGGRSARVGVSDHGRATQLLTEAGFSVALLPGRMLSVTVQDSQGQDGQAELDLARITHVLADHGLYVNELTPVRPDLESVFLDLTADEHLGAAAGHSSAPEAALADESRPARAAPGSWS